MSFEFSLVTCKNGRLAENNVHLGKNGRLAKSNVHLGKNGRLAKKQCSFG